MEQNLPELRDIHLPEGVSAFPPAYGWWVILGGILLLLLLTELFLIVRRKSKKRYALYLLAHVRQENAVAAALQVKFCVGFAFINTRKQPPFTVSPGSIFLIGTPKSNWRVRPHGFCLMRLI